jgi:hypothetical protein
VVGGTQYDDGKDCESVTSHGTAPSYCDGLKNNGINGYVFNVLIGWLSQDFLSGGNGQQVGTNGGVCKVVGALGQTGRLRLGADFAAGIGPFAKLGFGVSLRGDASIEFDLYFGGGAGLGLVGGGGLGLDNAGGQTRGGAFSVNQDASLSVGAGLVGFGVTKPFSSSYTQFHGEPTQYNGGFGFGPQIGPKLGIAGGISAGTGNATYRTSGLCH